MPDFVVTFFPHSLHHIYLQIVLSVRTPAPSPIFLWDSSGHVAVTVALFHFPFFSIKGEGLDALLRSLRIISELEQFNVQLMF